jgi:chromosome segregation ATPase
MLTDFLRYVLPALIGALSAVLGVGISLRVQGRKVKLDDASTLRTSLMEERKQLVREIESLKIRCDTLEKTIQEQSEAVLELRERNQQLATEIRAYLQSRCDALEATVKEQAVKIAELRVQIATSELENKEAMQSRADALEQTNREQAAVIVNLRLTEPDLPKKHNANT